MPHNVSVLLIELGGAVIGLAILARVASRWSLSPIPLYLIAGLIFGNGGIAPLNLSHDFIHIGAEIGVLLLLFMLGIHYDGEDLKRNLRTAFPAGIANLLLNFSPGLIAGLAAGWHPMASVLLGGVTYVSSSGITAKVIVELGRQNNPETPSVLSLLVLEDLTMAVYLPLVAALLIGGGWKSAAISVSIAMTVVFLVLFVALRYGNKISTYAGHDSDEIILLTTFGTVLLVAGLAQRLQVPASIGAFLTGIAVSGPIAEKTHRLMAPLRDLFAAIFFFFFGLEIDPATLPSALPFAAALALVTALTKLLAGYWTARRAGVDREGGLRAGAALIARGEFSIVVAALGVGIEPRLGPLAAAYVLLLAITGPVAAHLVSS